VREVLRVTQGRDAEAALWLEIIDRFDDVGAGGATAVELARVAAQTTGRPVGLQDAWNGVALEVAGGELRRGPGVGADVTRAAIGARLRGRHAAPLPLDSGSALAASVETGAGRIGTAWLRGAADADWRPLDFLVVERFAAALATHALEARAGRTDNDPAALERLLGGGLGDYELAQGARRAGLSPGREHLVVAVEQSPPNAVSLETLGAIVERALDRAGVGARAAVVGRIAVIVAAADAAVEPALRALSDRAGVLGFAIGAGVSEPVGLDALDRGWSQARDALALRRMTGSGGHIGLFRELQELHLLAQIPKEDVLAAPLVRRIAETLGQHGSPSDFDVLEHYLDEGTLRRAAAKVFLHHTSVEHRIKRIEEALDVQLADAGARFEVHLAMKLLRILQARDAARAQL
jgi:hypothetical protein